jgi:hypothetical protein
MGRFHSEFNQDLQKSTTAKIKARRNAASKLAAAAVFGIEHLEERALFTVAPVANPGGPYSVNEGSSITINASGSTHAGGTTITSYEWDLHWTGTFQDSLNQSGAQLNYSATSAAKAATLALEVVQSDGQISAPVTFNVTTNWVAPTINVTGGGAVSRGTTVPISWTQTSADSEAITNWIVNWGDGTTSDTLAGSASSDSHVYAQDGNFTITVTSQQTVLGSVATSSGSTSADVSPVLPVITLTGNPHVNELATYTLGFSAVDPSGIDTWAINWGDGTQTELFTGSTTSATHAYATHGDYTITTTAVDTAGDSSQATLGVIADDVPPAPVITGAPISPINEGDTVNLSATPNDPGSATTTYLWTVTSTNPSFSLPQNTVLTNSTLSFVAGCTGSYTATVAVTDDASETTSQSKTFTANAVPPTVTITPGYSTAINKGQSVSLTANPADVGIDDTYTYAWSATLGGQPYTLPSGGRTGQTFNFVAGRSGNFVVSVLVTDRDNGTDTASTSTITAAPVAPTATISGEPGTSIGEGTPFTITDTPSDTGVDESFTYAWTLDKTVNGNTTQLLLPSSVATNTASFTYTPEDEGTYVATCIVTDSDGNTVSTSSQNIVVTDVVPTVAITGAPTSSINEGAAVNLTATPTEASTDRTYSYLWSVARTYNGNTTGVTLANGTNTSAALSFIPGTEGTYVATCVVTDDEGGSTTQASSNITVATVPATVTITGDTSTSINEGTAVNLSASSAEPGSGHSFTYSWAVTENGLPYNFSAPAGTASASSTYGNTNYNPSEAFDGSASTFWDSDGSAPQYLQWDMGAGQSAVVTRYGLTPYVPFGPNYAPTGWTFQGSNDASSWTTLDTESGQTLSATQYYSISNSTAYRYYRLNISEVGSGGAYFVALADLSMQDANGNSVINTTGGGSSTGATASFTPTTKGNYVATVTATDEDGHMVWQGSNTITVNNVPPTVTVSGTPNSSIAEGTAVALTSTATEPGPGGYTYLWTVMNGTTPVSLAGNASATTSALNFTPVAEGTYVATLKVTDSESGVTTQNSQGFVVTPVAPTVTMTGTPQAPVNELSPLTLGVTTSEVNPANTEAFAWTVTKGGVAYALPGSVVTDTDSLTYTPDDPGTWAASCVVTNSEGLSTTQSSGNITVSPVVLTANIGLNDGARQEGTAIAATAQIGNTGATDPITYSWSVLRDGSAYSLPNTVNTTGSAFTFTPGDEGSYVVDLTATNSGGPVSTSTSPIIVADVAPVVAITGAPTTSAPEGTPITLGTTITQTGANDGVASYAWTLTDGTQSVNLTNVTTNASTFTFTPMNEGNYVASVTVTNAADGNIAGGQTQRSTSGITVVNVPPVVSVTGTTGPVADGSTLNFTSSVTEAGANTLSYAWTVKRNAHTIILPIGVSTTGSTLSFAAGRAGSFVATCTVTDSEEGVGSASSNSVAVTDLAPVVSVSGEPVGSVAAGTPVALTATASDAGAGEHLSYAWSVSRNGGPYTLLNSVLTNTATLDFTPDRVGSYIATVTVTDTDGGATSASTTAMPVTDVAPTVTVTGPVSAVNEGQSISFSSIATNPTIGDTFTYSWAVTLNGSPFTLPNGTATTGSSLSFVAPQGGTYEATASVTDFAGSVGTGSGSTTVNWVAPTVSITGTPTLAISAGSSVALAAVPAEAGSGHTYAYAWSVTRNGVAYTLPNSVVTTALTLSFHPGRAGAFAASVTITDEDGQNTTIATAPITVLDVAPAVGINGAPLASIPEGQSISLTASPSSPGADETFSYQWSVTRGGVAYTLPNGVATNTSALSFRPGVAGSYVASVTVTDLDNGVTTVSTAPMVVSSTAATVNITGAPHFVNAGTTINLTASATDSGPGEQFSYAWTVTINGQPYALPQGTSTTSSGISFITTDSGLYEATCVATDTSGRQGIANTGDIIVDALPPTVSITGMPSSDVNEGTSVSLTAVPADADSADTYTYAWSVAQLGNAFTLPDGTVTNTAAFTFTPNDPGTFIATVVVTDKAGFTATTSATITSDDVAPAVSIDNAPQAPVSVGTALSFTSTVTNFGANDLISSYAWSVTKNGSAYSPLGNPTTNGSSFTFTPDGEGTYVVSLNATNSSSLVGTASTDDIIVRPVAPAVTVSGTTGTINEGDPVALTATATDPSTGDTYTYAWTVTLNGVTYSLPDTVATNVSTLDFNANQVSTYVANVTVTDADNLQTIGSSTLIIAADVPPTVAISGEPDSSIAENSSAVALTATTTEPGSGQTYTYAWTVTKNGSAFTLPVGVATNASTLTFTPGRTGSYIATCNVTDGDGGAGSASSTAIGVTAVNPLVVITGEPMTSVGEGTPLALSASASDPGVADTFSYAWAITRNASNYTPPVGTALNTSALNFTPGLPGAYIATCTVTDGDGAIGSQSSTSMTVTTVSPSVTLSGAPGNSVNEGSSINLLATPTSPRTNDSFGYAWSVTKNGQAYTLPNSVATNTTGFSFTPTTDGIYVAAVVVTDLDSATATVATSAITVVNVPPTATIQGVPGGVIATGTSFSLTAGATEPGNGGYTYAWTVNGAQVPASTSQTYSGTAQLSGTYHILLTVTDAEGGVGTATGTITVSDVAPAITITGAPTSTPEGIAITLGSTAADPGAQFGETFSYLWTVTRNGVSFPVTNAAASSFTFTPAEYGSYVTTLTVTDSQGTASTTTANTSVTNVAPTSTLAAVPTALRGTAVTFAGTFADAGTADGETITWNYGDGTSQSFASTAANALTPTHTYAGAGTYTATMTVTDSGGLSSISTQTVSVVGAELEADPFSAGKTALIVTGTTSSDSIKFYSESGGRVKVTLDGALVGVFAPTGHIIAEGMGSGNDTISVASAIKLPTVIYGNAGADSLYGGGGNNILIAGTGNDSLYAGAGADILVGGNGKDVLNGGAGNDLLVGGNWPFAGSQSDLAAIDAQWTRTDESFATIVHQLRGVQSGSLAGSDLVSTSNVTNTNGEFLICGSGRDWLLPVGGDIVEDFVTSKDVESGGVVSKANTRTKA